MVDDAGADKTPKLRLPETTRYEVSYGKPPAHSRFQKGSSGNPKGRPRGRRRATADRDIERMKSIIKAEAYRTIRVPDAGGVVTMTLAEAVIRSISVNAAKGQARAQRLFTELLHVTERSEAIQYNQYLEAMIEYKVSWEKELERRKALGISAPDLIPHPDDIIVDMHTGRASVRGPWTAEEKAAWDKGLAYRDELQEEFSDQVRMSKKGKWKAFWRQQAAFTQHLYDRFNSRLPPR